jgi:hypothetical protein
VRLGADLVHGCPTEPGVLWCPGETVGP